MGWLDNWRTLDGTVLEVPQGASDWTRTAVVVEGAHSDRIKRFAEILKQEVQKRARVEWVIVVSDTNPSFEAYNVVIHFHGLEAVDERIGTEGYIIELRHSDAGPTEIDLSACSDRGLLFATGRLLREMKMDFHISYAKELESLCCGPESLSIVSRPKYAMRQHQVAYRPKTNSYDGFSVSMMKQEILDLALFGTNGIEMIPPGIDDALQSPNFHVPWLDMLGEVSRWCDELDICVSIWYPAFFKSYADPEMFEAAKQHWSTIFGKLTRLDRLFIPGGDPGGRPADEFFQVVEMQASFMRQNFFPDSEVWVSSQYGLSTSVDLGLLEPWVPLVQEQLWFEMLHSAAVQEVVDGVVYGPWSCCPIEEFRAQAPARLPLRNYPDLCHVQTAQMPVHGWDLSFAVTNGRESINPRPREMAAIIDEQAEQTVGCGCYSEGVSDDVNKYVWTALHWGDDVVGPLKGSTSSEQLDVMLRQYVSFLMDQPRNVDSLVEGIYTLETNWSGDLLSSESIVRSQKIFTQVQSSLAPRHRRNWRLNMLLFRANHDGFLYTRLVQERKIEAEAFEVLRGGCQFSDLKQAASKLQVPYNEPPITMSSFNSRSTPNPLNITILAGAPSITHLYGQLMALAATLYHQIGMQLSVGYGGQHRQRGAYFDLIWSPLGDVVSINRIIESLIGEFEADENSLSSSGLIERLNSKLSERELAIVRRFRTSLKEFIGDSPLKVLWYASFGDERAHELPGCPELPTRTIPVEQVLPPHRPIHLGEDPQYFERPMVEYLDTSNDDVIRDLHDGLIPRAWRSFLVPVWPRTARFSMRFPLDKLFNGSEVDMEQTKLVVRITYLGNEINRHGGDWEELDRQAQPTRLLANGLRLHNFIDPKPFTQFMEVEVTSQVLRRALEINTLILTWEPRVSHKTTFRYVPIPIAELWILQKHAVSAVIDAQSRL